MSQQLQIPSLSLGGGLYIFTLQLAGVDASSERAVKLIFPSGHTIELNDAQSEECLVQLGLKTRRIVPAGAATLRNQ